MFNNIEIGKYIYKESLIHKINPFIKILSVLFISIFCMLSNFFENILLFLVIFLLIVLSKVDIKNYIKSILSIKIFIISILIIDLIFNNNILEIFNNTLKMIIIMINTSILMFTTKINDMNYGITNLLKPLKIFKIDINKISIIITLAIKYIYVILDESNQLLNAYKSRGLDFKGKFVERINKVKNYISTLFYIIMIKISNISSILELRNIDIKRINVIKNYKINKIDLLYLISITLYLVVVKGVILCVI